MKLSAPREEVEAWLTKARQDVELAGLVLARPALAALGGFHCQQAVEKCLKACLAATAEDVPKVHDLVALAASVRAVLPALHVADEDLDRLSVYAVAPRYPGFADDQAAHDLPALLAISEGMLAHVSALLLGA